MSVIVNLSAKCNLKECSVTVQYGERKHTLKY